MKKLFKAIYNKLTAKYFKEYDQKLKEAKRSIMSFDPYSAKRSKFELSRRKLLLSRAEKNFKEQLERKLAKWNWLKP